MKQRIQLTIPFALLLAAGCASSTPSRIDNALLSELTSTSMAGVTEARAVRDSAEDRLAKSERDMLWAEEQVELTRSNLNVARTELADAKLAMVVAERSGTVGQLESARQAFTYAAARADEVRELLSLRKREFERSKLARKVALEEYRLNAARVELQKAEAVQELDRVAARQVPVKDYRKQVRYHETEVALARVRLEAMDSEVEDAEREYEAVRAKTASMQRGS